MKVLIIGGVAAGTKVAAKLKGKSLCPGTDPDQKPGYFLRRLRSSYYVGGLIKEREELIVNSPAKFSKLTGASVETGIEVTKVDRSSKTVSATNLSTQKTLTYSYDKLIIATGASPVVPPVEESIWKMFLP